MCSRTIISLLAGLVLAVTLHQLNVTGQSAPGLYSNPPVADLEEGEPWELKCIFLLFSDGREIVVGTEVTTLRGNTVPVGPLHSDAVVKISGDVIEYTILTTPNRTLNNVRLSCIHNVIVNGTFQSFIVTKTLVVKYGPLENVSQSTSECVNITSSSGDQSVRLDASGIFQDPGNPTSKVQWAWEGGSPRITDGIGGSRDGILTRVLTVADKNRVIVARYDNGIGFTFQQFILCINTVPGLPIDVMCSPVVNGCSCLWKPPADKGGYMISHYKGGLIKGSNKPLDLVLTIPSSAMSFVNNTLQSGVTYTFAVSAANVLGSGASGFDSCTPPRRPEPPTNISVVPLSRFSLEVSWDPPPNPDIKFPVTGYLISLHDMPSPPSIRTDTVNGEMRKTTFSGLNDNTTYWIRVSSGNAVGFGSFSNFVMGRTLPNGTVGSVSAESISFTEVGGTSFRVQWDTADAGGSQFEIKQYNVEVRLKWIGEFVTSVVVNGDQTWAKIDKNLQPETDYEVQIFADNGNGYGLPSQLQAVSTTKEPRTSDDAGLISGIVIVVTEVIVLVIIIIFYCYKKKTQGKRKEAQDFSGATNPKPSKGQKIQSSPYELSGQAIYTEVRPAEQRATKDQMTQSSAYELSGQPTYTEVRSAEERESTSNLSSNPAYSFAADR